METKMSAKLKVKLGHIEIECEGSEEFVKAELPTLVKSFSELAKTIPVPPVAPATGGNGTRSAGAVTGEKIELSVGAIAQKLNADSGPELVVAASAYLTLVEGKDTFNRKELLKKMKDAPNHFKTTYTGNLTSYLTSAAGSGKIIERSSGVFALTAPTRKQLEAALGQE